jgi:hypothetical protein
LSGAVFFDAGADDAPPKFLNTNAASQGALRYAHSFLQIAASPVEVAAEGKVRPVSPCAPNFLQSLDSLLFN